MKKTAFALAALLLAFCGLAQGQAKFSVEDAKQFYNTLQGDYSLQVNDSVTVSVHITPIWESQPFRWLYVEASKEGRVVEQKVLEVQPKNDKVFKVKMHDLKNPRQFVGKWGNRNYFDGFNSSILKSGRQIAMLKTSDFSYQTNWIRLSGLRSFPKGDLLHFKFVQEDERFYIKRMPKGTDRIVGYQGIREME